MANRERHNAHYSKLTVAAGLIIALAAAFYYFTFVEPPSLLISENRMTVCFLDVGQGDCEYIQTPGGKAVLIDGGGRPFSSVRVGTTVVEPFLRQRGINKVDTAIVSHYHDDHGKGIAELLEDGFAVDNLLMPDSASRPALHDRLYDGAARAGARVSYVKAGNRLDLEENVNAEIFFPDAGLLASDPKNNNNDSIVIRFKYFRTSFVFTGDIEAKAEKVISGDARLRSDVLKVAHHGSNTSTTEAMLRIVMPKYAVIGVGANNSYGHPKDEVLERLNGARVTTYRTDRDGTVTFTVDENGIVSIEKSRNGE